MFKKPDNAPMKQHFLPICHLINSVYLQVCELKTQLAGEGS